MNTKTVRNIREPLKKPRPLKTVSTPDAPKFLIPDPKDTVVLKSKDEILADLEILNLSISDCNFDEITTMDISRMCAILKKRGEELDMGHKDAVDRYFCTLRNACREERLDMVSRVKLLEVIELRAREWKKNENINNYFNMKIIELEHKGPDHFNYTGITSPTTSFPLQNVSSTPSIPLAPGEILRSSGKFDKPTKVTGKNYFKDEIRIRNSDSGKVMGIKGRRVHMIEELSDTVISFQRVNPGARDRLVQITGPHEEAIGHAKLLVEDTIRRNASPVRENVDMFENRERVDFGNSFSTLDNQNYVKKNLQHSYSMSDASLREYNLPLQIGQDLITLTGTNADLLKTAKMVLKDYFGELDMFEKQHEQFTPLNRHSSPENMARFELRRQSSLKQNMENNSSWNSQHMKRDSISPFSSSDDEIGREERKFGLERAKAVQDLPIHNFADSSSDMNTRHSMSSDSSIVSGGKFTRSISVPNETDIFADIKPMPHNEVFSPLLSPDPDAPPIPPPSYTYSREFLLNCAKSPFSHNQPKDYALMHQNFKDIINQSPVMFDPEKYEESRSEESTVCVLK